MKKTYILDTNVLLHDPQSIHKFEDNNVIITGPVIEELDKKKLNDKGPDTELNANAREATRNIKEAFNGNGNELDIEKIKNGVKVNSQGGIIRILMSSTPMHGPTKDDEILQLVLANQEKLQKPIIVVTKDLNMGLKALGLGLGYQDYRNDKAKAEVKQIPEITFEVIPELESRCPKTGEYMSIPNLFERSFVQGDTQKPMTQGYYFLRINSEEKRLLHVNSSQQVKYVPRRPGILKSEVNSGIKPKNIEQVAAIDALMDPTKSLVILTGKAGTGKTLLAVAAAIQRQSQKKEFCNNVEEQTAKKEKMFRNGHSNGPSENPEEAISNEQTIYITRPMISLGQDLGALPGDIEEKMGPWIEPINDNLRLLLGYEHAQKMQNMGMIQLQPLATIRGRSLNNAILIVDESQNLTPLEAKTLITRAGHNCLIIMTGDPDQIDNPYVDRFSNGMSYVADRMGLERTVSIVPLTIGERSELSDRAAELL